jgi:hypothetical protein
MLSATERATPKSVLFDSRGEPMRLDGFLRAPIRGDHQGRLLNLKTGDVALAGDPDPASPYPQTLEIEFDVDAAVKEVQIAPLWEGMLRFIPDSTLNHPTVPTDVTEAQFPNWAVVGDLILRNYVGFGPSELDGAFAVHIPFVSPVPTSVCYSKVRLTREFLFTTLGTLSKHRLMFGASVVRRDDPLYTQKLIIKFLAGQASVPCLLDPATPANDDALQPMPSVALAAAGVTTFRVALSSLSEELLTPTWFDARPEYDALAGDPLVRPPLNTFAGQMSNPAHPSHSSVPARVIYQSAAADAFAPDHGPATPVRIALSAARADGTTYRRIELIRPPIPGPPVGAAAHRPYPMYRLCWQSTVAGVAESMRIPLSGRLYLPLADGTYTFWVIPRSETPAAVVAGDHIRLSTQAPLPARYIALPQTTLDVALPVGTTGATIFAHAQAFDARFVWQRYREVQGVRAPLKAAAKTAWNVDVLDWFILPTTPAREPYSALYGYIRESAGRHGLAPEFLQVVFFGEGGGVAIDGAGPFDPSESLDTFGFVGLDLILYRTGRLPIGAPSHPPEVPAAAVDEMAEFAFNLVTEGYLDPVTASAVSFDREVVRTEAGFTRTLQIGKVTGWQAAIEMVAAELHARLDEMVAYLASKVPSGAPADEKQRCFLAYVRFNSRPSTAKGHADNLAARVRPWPGAPPPGNENVLFNTLQRLAVTAWHEAAGVYRIVE